MKFQDSEPFAPQDEEQGSPETLKPAASDPS